MSGNVDSSWCVREPNDALYTAQVKALLFICKPSTNLTNQTTKTHGSSFHIHRHPQTELNGDGGYAMSSGVAHNIYICRYMGQAVVVGYGRSDIYDFFLKLCEYKPFFVRYGSKKKSHY